MIDETLSETESRVEVITNAMLHLPIRGKELEFAARQIDLALNQAGHLRASFPQKEEVPVAWPPAVGSKVSVEFEVRGHCSMGEPAWVSLWAPGITTDISYADRATLSALQPTVPNAGEDGGWHEIHQEAQPTLREGYTAIAVVRPGVWLVKGQSNIAAALVQP